MHLIHITIPIITRVYWLEQGVTAINQQKNTFYSLLPQTSCHTSREVLYWTYAHFYAQI